MDSRVSLPIYKLSGEEFENDHILFWYIFEKTLGKLFNIYVERKTLSILRKYLNGKYEYTLRFKGQKRDRLLFKLRQNFTEDRIKDLFLIKALGFNYPSVLMEHFCQWVANAQALDDVYNVRGDFLFDNERIFPVSAKPDLLSRFHLSCPNGQAVRNRYRQVLKLLQGFEGNNILSIACGSAQPLIHYAYLRKKEGRLKGLKITLTDPNKESLSLARKIAEKAGVVECIDFKKVSFGDIPKQFDGCEFDLVEACGILDYLSDRQVVRLIRCALSVLSDEGSIILSNMIKTKEGEDVLKRRCNWEVVYRDPFEFFSLLENAGGKNTKVYVEPWGIHSVATITK